MVQAAVSNPAQYATSFGYAGTYWDYVQEMVSDGVVLDMLMDLNIRQEEVAEILTQAEFKGYRFDGALQWIVETIEMIKMLGGCFGMRNAHLLL